MDVVDGSGALEMKTALLLLGIPVLNGYFALVGTALPTAPKAGDCWEEAGDRVWTGPAEAVAGKVYVDSPTRSVSVATWVTTSVAGQPTTPEGQEVSVAVRVLKIGDTETSG